MPSSLDDDRCWYALCSSSLTWASSLNWNGFRGIGGGLATLGAYTPGSTSWNPSCRVTSTPHTSAGHCLPHALTPSLLHSLTPSLPHSLTPSRPHSLTPSLPHSLTPSLPHSLTPSRPHSLTPSLLHSLTPSRPHALTPSLPHALTPSLTHGEESKTHTHAMDFVLEHGLPRVFRRHFVLKQRVCRGGEEQDGHSSHRRGWCSHGCDNRQRQGGKIRQNRRQNRRHHRVLNGCQYSESEGERRVCRC